MCRITGNSVIIISIEEEQKDEDEERRRRRKKKKNENKNKNKNKNKKNSITCRICKPNKPNSNRSLSPNFEAFIQKPIEMLPTLYSKLRMKII